MELNPNAVRMYPGDPVAELRRLARRANRKANGFGTFDSDDARLIESLASEIRVKLERLTLLEGKGSTPNHPLSDLKLQRYSAAHRILKRMPDHIGTIEALLAEDPRSIKCLTGCGELSFREMLRALVRTRIPMPARWAREVAIYHEELPAGEVK